MYISDTKSCACADVYMCFFPNQVAGALVADIEEEAWAGAHTNTTPVAVAALDTTGVPNASSSIKDLWQGSEYVRRRSNKRMPQEGEKADGGSSSSKRRREGAEPTKKKRQPRHDSGTAPASLSLSFFTLYVHGQALLTIAFFFSFLFLLLLLSHQKGRRRRLYLLQHQEPTASPLEAAPAQLQLRLLPRRRRYHRRAATSTRRSTLPTSSPRSAGTSPSFQHIRQ